MPNKLIKDLIDKGAVTLKEQGYSIRSSEYTLLTWKQFQEFCNKKGYETYLPSHKDEFITELGKCTPPLRQSTIDRKAGSMKMLDLLATKGTWGKGMLNPLQELLPEFNSFDLPDLQPWDPVWNRPKQIIQHDAPTAKQFAESENIYVLVWMVNKRMEQLGLSENTVRHYTEEGLAVILKKHYDSGTESYSDKLISQLTDERRLQYEQGEVGRTTYQNLRKAAAMLQEFRLTGKITLERIPNWGRREVIPQHKAILDKFSAHVTTQSNWAESSVSTVTSVARVFLLELEDHGIVSIETVAMMDIATCVTRMLGRYTGGMRSALFGIRTFSAIFI